MPKSNSNLGLSQRRARAFEFFALGYTNRSVALELNVHVDTVAKYRAKYEERIHAQAAANPNFLKDVLTNTVRSLEELDRIREDAWKQLQRKKVLKTEHTCPECETVFIEKERIEISDQTRAQYHNVLLKAQDQRSKLFGVIGLKQEVLIAVMQIKVVQDKVLEWMSNNLEGDTREALATFLESPELKAYTGGPVGAIDAESVEVLSRAS